MNNEIEYNEENKLYWPKFEYRQQKHYEYHTKHLKDLDYTISISKKNVCLQAGGNVGIWPLKLKDHYKEILSFEPDPALYQCMVKNLEKIKNVKCFNYALSDKSEDATFCRSGKSGTGFTTKDDTVRDEMCKIKSVTIDSLNLKTLDVMFLDIEGFEEYALKGAEDTIKRLKPIIHIELLLHKQELLHNMLTSYGYTLLKRQGKDGVYRFGK
jgi:FkbM family methyltransferase